MITDEVRELLSRFVPTYLAHANPFCGHLHAPDPAVAPCYEERREGGRHCARLTVPTVCTGGSTACAGDKGRLLLFVSLDPVAGQPVPTPPQGDVGVIEPAGDAELEEIFRRALAATAATLTRTFKTFAAALRKVREANTPAWASSATVWHRAAEPAGQTLCGDSDPNMGLTDNPAHVTCAACRAYYGYDPGRTVQLGGTTGYWRPEPVGVQPPAPGGVAGHFIPDREPAMDREEDNWSRFTCPSCREPDVILQPTAATYHWQGSRVHLCMDCTSRLTAEGAARMVEPPTRLCARCRQPPDNVSPGYSVVRWQGSRVEMCGPCVEKTGAEEIARAR
jgi:hypothetical protein